MVSKEQVSYETRRADRGESNSGAVAGLVHCYVSRSQTDVRRLSVSKELPIKKEKKKEKKYVILTPPWLLASADTVTVHAKEVRVRAPTNSSIADTTARKQTTRRTLSSAISVMRSQSQVANGGTSPKDWIRLRYRQKG